MTHGSKNKSIHEHRGTIEVICTGSALHKSGEQSEMVLDFGFLKDAMMNVIDKSIDYGVVASVDDRELLRYLIPDHLNRVEAIGFIRASLNENGYWLSTEDDTRTLNICTIRSYMSYLTSRHPNVWAEHFFRRLQVPVEQRSNGIG
jgi:6-pyruvoyltetrahydropterin/6-carboxytetrahydropterin synthase